MDDRYAERAVISAQIGRPARADGKVVRRCHLSLPVVVEMPPLLDDGTPFPTRYWLTCPLATRRLGRLESAGGVAAAEARLAEDPSMRARMGAAHARYAADRDAELPVGVTPRPQGGVGGIVGAGVKCLHAHYADHAAGNDNPVGAEAASAAEPLNCAVGCVVQGGDGSWVPNPKWHEPPR